MSNPESVSSGPPRANLRKLPSGYEMHYHDLGQGPVVVLIQGSGPGANGWSNFKFNIQPLVAAGYRVVVPDLLGFGYSSKPTDVDYTLDLFTSTLLELLDALRVDRCVAVGNSLGGAVAINIALQRPGYCSKLVLMGCGGVEETATYFQMPGIQKMVTGFVGQGFDRDGLRRILEMLSFDPVHVDDALVDERLAILKLMPKEVMARMRIPDLTPRLPELTLPILGFWGIEDQFCPASSALKLAAACPNSRFVLYSRVGHWVMIERAAEFNREVAAFLSA